MKGRLLKAAALLAAVIICGAVWYMSPVHLMRSISAEDIGAVYVFDGSSGSDCTICDREQIEYIVNNLKGISFKRSGISLGKQGYRYRMTFKNVQGKTIDELIINSSGVLRRDPFFYRDKSNSLCEEYIGNIMH